MKPSEKLAYSIPDLMHASGLGRTFIYSEIAAGRLKVKKAGSRTIILPEDAQEWLRGFPGLWKRHHPREF